MPQGHKILKSKLLCKVQSVYNVLQSVAADRLMRSLVFWFCCLICWENVTNFQSIHTVNLHKLT